jgi:serine/threonine protein kinase/tetratricopeptide (TPR) repeat protein
LPHEESGTIGPYRLLEPLGQGGMGIVYRARHVASERAVALKTVKVHAPKWLDSIRREIHALRRVQHPGVVRIVEDGVQQGRPWYAMDLLEGESLRHFGHRIWSKYRVRGKAPVSSAPVSATDAVPGLDAEPAEVLRPASSSHWRSAGRPPAGADALPSILQIMRRITATLGYLHGEGMVNCDLKPENVLLANGEPVIIDFGLAARHPGGSGREALEAPGGRSGTLPYMSPEQIRGEFVDARSDLYAVGCVLYELVVGAPPFAGPPRTIMMQHLSEPPIPPSDLVTGLPEELERVILRLLAKRQAERYGYADEVAAVLGELAGDLQRLPDFPPSRSYVYRSRFVGREEIAPRIIARRDRAADGTGALVLVGGESGVGKTRFAMELTRFELSTPMRIVTSEVSSLHAEGASAAGITPLQALRPLLRAIADRCQEGGADVTERLLGDRRPVLAPYESLLGHVPARESIPPPPPLGVEASRQRLFKYLAETIAAFAHEQPLVWVVDDLGWADELSLAFFRSLDADFFEQTPVFILCTYRSEEPAEALLALAQRPHVEHVVLPRLAGMAVASMIGDMLANQELPAGFLEFVIREAEGNPFFVAEYLRAAVNDRLLFRDRFNSWQLHDGNGAPRGAYESLGLPRSLRALIERRLRDLSAAAQQACLAAAVIGRNVDLEVLQQVASLSDEAMVATVDELLRRHVLDPPEPGTVRFAHDKLREVAYAQAPAERLRELHGRTARVLERRLERHSDPARSWAVLGHHFAVGNLPEQAARYLKLAAEHAHHTFANEDAVRLYREAIDQVNRILLSLSSDAVSWDQTLLQLQEALGDVLALIGRREDAQASFDDALGRVADHDRGVRARLYRKLGKNREMRDQADALRLYDLALTALHDAPTQGSQELQREWIQVHIDQLWVHYYLNRIADMGGIIAKVRPHLETHGSPSQRARFFQSHVLLNLRRHRYVVSEETLEFARAAARAGAGHESSAELRFALGFALLLHGSLAAATAELEAVLALSQRAGDRPLQARCLTYLTLAARMRGDVERVRDHAQRCADVADSIGALEYIAAARANKAWVALRQSDHSNVKAHAGHALSLWKSRVFPFQWMALLPLLEAELAFDLAGAVTCAQALLAPDQQILPGAAADAFAQAVTHWNQDAAPDSQSSMELGLRRLEQTGYR